MSGKTTNYSNDEATAHGRTSSEELITFLVCTNGDDIQRLRLRVIGEAKNPRAFKNKTLPSGNASEIFKDLFYNSFFKQVSEVI